MGKFSGSPSIYFSYFKDRVKQFNDSSCPEYLMEAAKSLLQIVYNEVKIFCMACLKEVDII